MRALTAPHIAAVLITGAATLFASAGSDIELNAREVMTRDLKFTTTELADLERGMVVKHSIASSVPGEIAVAGAVRIQAPKSRLLESVRDIVRFKRSPDVMQIGRFSNPPVIEDIAALTVEKDDFDSRSCRVGACDVRLPADLIRQVQREINAPDGQARAAALFKRLLLDSVRAYAAGASGRILQYDHREAPIRPADEFAAVLQNTPAVGALAPGLPEHLIGFPASGLDGAEDFLYWSKEKFGVGPFISVTHVATVCPTRQLCIIATINVYSSRFIDASLALTAAIDAVNTPDAFYMIYANRSRSVALKGTFSSFKRSIAERRARGSLDANLKMLKTRLESGS
jgi:hypothetical protein